MQVELKGMNVPIDVINEVLELYVPEDKRWEYKNKLTPEVLSAAYAKISRSKNNVNELIIEGIENVDKARKSNESIIYGLGHHSVADHALFNYNIMEVSRLLVESIEKRRLAGYTEKSQRYVTLDGDYVKPKEFSPEDLKKFEDLVKFQNEFYFKTNLKIFDNLKNKFKEDIEKAENPKLKLLELEGRAKEDARYSLSLATKAQLGCSYPGQTLELAIRELKYGDLEEEKEFSKFLYDETVAVAPSLIQLTDPELFKKHNNGRELNDDNFKYTRKNIRDLVENIFNKYNGEKKNKDIFHQDLSILRDENVALINDRYLDRCIITALLHSNSKNPIEDCYAVTGFFTKEDSMEFIKDCLRYVCEHDKLPREFETSNLFYEIYLSSSCFAQLKRHRMNTLSAQDYDPKLRYVVPESIEEVGSARELKDVCDRSSDLYYEFSPKYKEAAEYCLTNAHKRRVIFDSNIRQHYHISRMREDSHAQWEIRGVVKTMSKLIKKTAPVTTILLGGKDKFEEIRKGVYS